MIRDARVAWWMAGLMLMASTAAAAEPIQWNTSSLRATFAAPDDGMGLLSLRHGEMGAEFLRPPTAPGAALLWKVELTADRSDPDAMVTLTNADAAAHTAARREGDALVLQWRDVRLPDDGGTLDVTVRCAPDAATGMTAWTIDVDNHSSRFGIWRVIFPVIELGVIGESGLDDFMVCSPAEGRSVRNPIGVDAEVQGEQTLSDLTTDGIPVVLKQGLSAHFGFGAARPHGLPYPSGRGQMQLSAYYEKPGDAYYPPRDPGPGLYFSPHDGASHPKLFFYTPEAERGVLTFEMGNFPASSAEPGLDYHMPYPMIVGGFRGDWYDATRIYRAFALEQPWTAKGPLAERSDVPDWLKEIVAVIRADVKLGDNRVAMPMLQSAWERLPGVFGVQWYNWSAVEKKPETGGYAFPPVSDPPEGYADMVAHLQTKDMHVFPYVNTRVWDVDAPGYDQALPHINRHANGELVISEWGDQVAAHVCVQSSFWENYLTDTARQIVGTLDADGLYLDQAGGVHFGGAYLYNACHDPSHGHPLGVTQDLVRAEHDRMAAILDAGREIKPDLVLTGEGVAENFIDLFANKLIHYEIWPGYVPLFAAVYHDYTTAYGRTVQLMGNDPADPIPAMQIGWQLVLGNQIGRVWISVMREQYLENEVAQRHLDYLVRACEVRERWPEFMILGEMLRPPHLLTGVPLVVTQEFRRDQVCTLPAVLASTWRAPDGRVATVVTNISNEPLTAHLGIDPAELGVTGVCEQLYPTPGTPASASAEMATARDGELVTVTLELEPLAVRVLGWDALP